MVSANFARAEGKRAEENIKLAHNLDGKVRELDQLAGVVPYERAIANEKELYPPWPHKVEAMETVTACWICEAWSDGHMVHAPVGSFAANAFGPNDVHGNVREWCRDE